MSYYEKLSANQIEKAEQIKKNVISALEEEFKLLKQQYDTARKRGVVAAEHALEQKFKQLNQEIGRIQRMTLPEIIAAYPRLVRRIQKNFEGNFELRTRYQSLAKFSVFFIILGGILVARLYGEVAAFLFVIMGFALLAIFISHKRPPELVAVKA